ncbi:MAG: KOW domain-containing RNA-binding protein [Eubacteriales bacterium]|nr:KOW domain-containing RNA-binding protein [Eubacteriales bacterium]
MERYRTGMLARSKAGHDAGRVYVIMDIDDAYVYLADGRIRTLENPKKKKIRHIQLINRVYDVASVNDAQIRRILKEFNKEEEI